MLQVRERRATPARWRAALARAVTNGLEAFVAADDGERFVTSGSRLDTLHRCDAYRCSCEAAFAGDECCQHRALVRHLLGWLPEPEFGTITCKACRGRGWVYVSDDHTPPVEAACRKCDGTGRRTVVVVLPTDSPLPAA